MIDGYEDPELSLHGMDYAQAREYVLAYVKTLHKLDREFQEKLQEVIAWERRHQIAEKSSHQELAEVAGRKVQLFRSDAARLKAEKMALEAKVEVLQGKLKQKSEAVPFTNAKALLHQFEELLGPDAALEGQMLREEKEQAVEDELAMLKAKLTKS